MAWLWRRRALTALSDRVAALEERMERLECREDRDERDTAARLQDGIDSIMGYQWPPAKGSEDQ